MNSIIQIISVAFSTREREENVNDKIVDQIDNACRGIWFKCDLDDSSSDMTAATETAFCVSTNVES